MSEKIESKVDERLRKRGRKYKEALTKIEERKYKLEEAVSVIREVSANTAKFDQTIEVILRLGVDPKYADQMVRGYIVLPHGVGKTKKVAVIASGEKLKEAEENGADYAGEDELIEKINTGWIDFDAVVATPDVMRKVGKLGKVLGARGLMPSPKSGTVTFEVKDAIREIKAGKVEFKVDKAGIIHSGVGKASFTQEQLQENSKSFLDAVMKAKPVGAKGKYVLRAFLCATMTPSVELDVSIIDQQ